MPPPRLAAHWRACTGTPWMGLASQVCPLSCDTEAVLSPSHRSVSYSDPSVGSTAMSASPPPGPAALVSSGSSVQEEPALLDRHTLAGGVGRPPMALMYSVPSGATSMPGSLSSRPLTTLGLVNVVVAPAVGPEATSRAELTRPTDRSAAPPRRSPILMRVISP